MFEGNRVKIYFKGVIIMSNPTMKAINAFFKKQREEFMKVSIRTPRKKEHDSCFSSVEDLCEPPRYTGKLEKVGDQRSIIEHMKEKGMY